MSRHREFHPYSDAPDTGGDEESPYDAHHHAGPPGAAAVAPPPGSAAATAFARLPAAGRPLGGVV
ncbi:hypothetical protein LCE32_17925, partial [Streptomyces sp. 7G]|uniref:hypothetical protein n=1 Tax=Streptomyces sp. 7G TaxID=2877241 RepID=UPI001CD56F40